MEINRRKNPHLDSMQLAEVAWALSLSTEELGTRISPPALVALDFKRHPLQCMRGVEATNRYHNLVLGYQHQLSASNSTNLTSVSPGM